MPRAAWPSDVHGDTINDLAIDLAIDTTPDAATIRGLRLGRWQTRSFEVPVPVSLGRGISAQRRSLSGDEIQFTVTNNTPYVLRACALLSPSRTARMGDLAPGQTRSAIIRGGGTIAAGNIGLPPAAFETRTQVNIARAFANALGLGPEADADSGAEDTATPERRRYAFIGWFADPLIKARAEGSDVPDGSEVNLLFARLPAAPKVTPLPVRQNHAAPRSASGTQARIQWGEMPAAHKAELEGDPRTEKLSIPSARDWLP